MNAKDAAELLDMIIARAPALVAAGLRGRVELGDVAFTLEGATAADPSAQVAAPREAVDPLFDPATHGQFGEDAPRRTPRYRREPLIGDE